MLEIWSHLWPSPERLATEAWSFLDSFLLQLRTGGRYKSSSCKLQGENYVGLEKKRLSLQTSYAQQKGHKFFWSYTTAKTFAAALEGPTHGQQQIQQKTVPLYKGWGFIHRRSKDFLYRVERPLHTGDCLSKVSRLPYWVSPFHSCLSKLGTLTGDSIAG